MILSAPAALLHNPGPLLALRLSGAGCPHVRLLLGVELSQAPVVAVVLNVILISLLVFSGHGA